jgi:hypothetical protein
VVRHVPWLLVLGYLESTLSVCILKWEAWGNATSSLAASIADRFFDSSRGESHFFVSIGTWEMIGDLASRSG